MTAPLPDPPAGVHLATRSDRIREAGWVFRSLLWERIFTRRSTSGQRIFSLAIALIPLGVLWYIGWRDGIRGLIIAALVLLAVLALCAGLLRRQQRGTQTRVYVLDNHTATLTMTSNGDYWTIAGHNRSRKAPGAGSGYKINYCPPCRSPPIAPTSASASPRLHPSSPTAMPTSCPDCS